MHVEVAWALFFFSKKLSRCWFLKIYKILPCILVVKVVWILRDASVLGYMSFIFFIYHLLALVVGWFQSTHTFHFSHSSASRRIRDLSFKRISIKFLKDNYVSYYIHRFLQYYWCFISLWKLLSAIKKLEKKKKIRC